MGHYETEYSETYGFEDRRELNDQKILELLLPCLTKEGCLVHPSNLDRAPLAMGGRVRRRWIDPVKAGGDPVRPPDIQPHNPDFNIRGAEGLKSVLVEVKDFAQMNNTLSTGFKFSHVRTYLAVQHHYEMPVVLLFRDNPVQERGKVPRLSPYVSAFKEGDEYFWYGNLLLDMELHEPSCFLRNARRGDDQIRWVAQRGRGYQDDGRPVMKPLHDILRLLRDGSVAKRRVDPNDLPLWRFIQAESAARGYPKMREPDGGLVYFTAKGEA